MKNRTKLQKLTFCSMLTAISVILGIIARFYLTFMSGNLRITFENAPIVMAGMLFGPVYGGIVGLCSELISSISTSQSINPLITIGAGFIGIVAGFFKKVIERNHDFSSVCFAEITSQIIGSVIIKTAVIVIMYSSPLFITLILRILNYLPICILESLILTALYKNKALKSFISKSE